MFSLFINNAIKNALLNSVFTKYNVYCSDNDDN